jgi:uncharacterized membrane protein
MHQWSAGAWGSFGWPWLGLLWLVIFLLFWGCLLALLIWAVRSTAGTRHTHDTPSEVLRRRLAAGEISEEEYERIQSVLRDEP